MNVNDPIDERTSERGTLMESTGRPSRRVRLIGVTIFFAVFISLVFFKTGRPAPKPDWRKTKSGNLVRIHAVTVGKSHRLAPQPEPFGSKLGEAFRRMTLAPFFRARLGGSGAYTSSNPSTYVWLASAEGKDVSTEGAEIVLPDGQVLVSHSSGSTSGPSGASYSFQSFDLVAYTAPTFHYSVKIGGEQFEWDLPNPGYDPTVTEIVPQPLPQTKPVGPYELTLESLQFRPQSPNSRENYLQPKFKMTRDGKAMQGAISVGYSIRDGGGNVCYQSGLASAKGWKLLPSFSRTNTFPFQDNEVAWVGGVDVSKVPAAGETALIDIPEGASSAGVKLVGLFGAGVFELRNYELKSGKPAVSGGGGTSVSHDWNSKTTKVTLDKPSLVVLLRRLEKVIVFRDADGKPSRINMRYMSSAGNDCLFWVFEGGTSIARLGVADSELREATPVEFLVSPPPLPPVK